MKRITTALLLTSLLATTGCCCFRKRETVAAAPVCAPPVLACPSPCAQPGYTSAPVTYGMPYLPPGQ